MTGAYRRRKVTERIGTIWVEESETYWDDNATPRCVTCLDWGEITDEDVGSRTCPACKGAAAAKVGR